MPGFSIRQFGGNRDAISTEQRFYTSYSWEIVSFSNRLSQVLTDADYMVMLRTATLPQITFTKEEATGGTIKYKYAGKPGFEDIRISWYDSVNFSRVYKAWQELIYTHEFGVAPPNQYKAESKIRKYLADRPSTGEQTRSTQEVPESGNVNYNLFGSWPVTFKESELTYLEAAIKNVEITLSYDYFTLEIE